jgi:protein-L-isoaspartate(D-aspartate) O-methyltransferase
MVAEQIRARGVRSPHVVRAMGRVRREFFVPPSQTDRAYDDGPLPIGDGQTISQPFIVAFMVEALDLRGGERVLEIGTGSGYAAAVLAEIAGDVFTVERNARLAEEAGERLRRHGYRNVHVTHGDGTLGLPAAAPFDAILVTTRGRRTARDPDRRGPRSAAPGAGHPSRAPGVSRRGSRGSAFRAVDRHRGLESGRPRARLTRPCVSGAA